jgi:hypothetical protein
MRDNLKTAITQIFNRIDKMLLASVFDSQIKRFEWEFKHERKGRLRWMLQRIGDSRLKSGEGQFNENHLFWPGLKEVEDLKQDNMD